MSSYFIWIILIGMLLMMWFVSRWQRAMQEEQKRRTESTEKGLVPGNWVRTIGGFYGTVVEVDGDVVTLATPLGDETLWSKRAIAAIEEPPFGSASAHEESGADVEQTDDDIRESAQDAAEPQS
ncbi:preprotein translocase subunit YajC [Actinomyces oris]|uniref:Preprotein translocase subunit YajC n=1 Tax=Actinomyces oris TaxID=544580 RepID=A0A1Q8VL86_9ACTO|nr:preprotein translocase subunit YajC [Actinomyces oris]OLO48861.1 preprotein translocase subunit YajC [Actinomyces oris]